jgi:hypothetical protein
METTKLHSETVHAVGGVVGIVVVIETRVGGVGG